MKRILLFNDLSGLGNCSLAANMAVFSVMGFEPCAVPTAVLTNQSCYPSYSEMDYSLSPTAYAKAWEAAGIRPDGIYSGYFRTVEQMEQFEAAFLEKRDIPYFNDPVMGDLGAGYDNCSPAMVDAMRRLISRSALTTPNITELCLLTQTDYNSLTSLQNKDSYLEDIASLGQTLLQNGGEKIVVTGVKWKGKHLYNILITKTDVKFLEAPLLEGDFSGTGDLFSSVVSAGLLKGVSPADSIRKAADFITQAIRFTSELKRDGNDGLSYQPLLKNLIG